MDQDDDAWSYSLPPSIEDLLTVSNDDTPKLVVSGSNQSKFNTPKKNTSIENTAISKPLNTISPSATDLKEESGEPFPSIVTKRQLPETPKDATQRQHSLDDKEVELDEHTPLVNTTTSFGAENSIAGDSIDTGDTVSTSGSQLSNGKSNSGISSSMHLQPAFMLKPLPADPQTTMKDVNSIISKEGHSNALNERELTLPPMSPGSGSEFKNSLRMWQQKNLEAEAEESRPETDVHSTDSGFMRRTLASVTSPILPYISRADDSNDPNNTDTSPKVITYRKNTHERKESNSYAELLDKEDRFDTRFYVKEKFRNTPYRFATIARNVEFHQIFRSHDLTDRLLDDFACALSREILLQGRLYVTEQSVCFNSNLLGWVTSLVIQFDDILKVEKKSTAGLFPNGILIETKNSKHNFASFLSRDATYEFIRTVWLSAVGKDLTELDAFSSEQTQTKEEVEDHQTKSERRISNYIMSIDEDAQGDGDWLEDQLENSEEDEENEENDAYSMESSSGVKETKEDSIAVANQTQSVLGSSVTLKNSSKYQNNGPPGNPATSIDSVFEDSEKEIEVGNVILDAPLGIVFDVMFGSAHTAFHRKVLCSQGATEISDYGSYLANDEDESIMERKYTYRRPLGYSIGPKSTKCCVTERIEHLDYSDHVVLLSVTSTPDVPSGGSFTVRTRFYFLWAENNKTLLRIAFYVKWSGSSWIKKVVESLTQAAQQSVTNEIIEMLKKEIEEHTEQQTSTTAVASTPPVKTAESTTKKPSQKSKEELRRQRTVKSTEDSTDWTKNWIPVSIISALVVIILVMMFVLWRLVRITGQTRALMEKQLQLTSGLVKYITGHTLDPQVKAFRGSGRNKREQAALLVKQALLLLDNPTGEATD